MINVSAIAPHKVEKFVRFLRVFGLFAGLVLVLTSDFPNTGSRAGAWATIAILLVATGVLWAWGNESSWGSMRLVHVGFAIDVLVVTGITFSWSYLDPNVSWSVAFLLLADAAMRYGVVGAGVGYVLAAALFIAQAGLHDAQSGQDTSTVALVFVLASLFGFAGMLAIFSFLLDVQAVMAQTQASLLDDAVSARDRLIATASHEFRGSLTAILVGAETVRTKWERLGPDRSRRVLDDVVRQGRHLQRLVEDLLLVSSGPRASVEITPRLDDASESIDAAVAAAGRYRQGHLLELSVEPVVCEIDHERFQQVVRNLLENAFKYSPPGSRVSLTLRHAEESLEVTITDHGPGIDPAERPRIFEPFRGTSDAHGHPDSFGLGLYLVKQIVDSMEGSLDLRSSDAGTEFVIRVPARFVPGLYPVRGTARPDDLDISNGA
ncbi:MAG: sensor histidine kinase [Nocardioidaceae bacterium]